MAERVTFTSSTGPRLAGILDLPEGETRGWGLFAHGFTLGKDSPAAARICKQLAAEGIGMLRFDNLGLGDSEGDWGDGSFTVKVADTVLAARFMAQRGTPVDLLVGHSWGGAAAIAAAPEAGVRAVVSVCAPFDPSHAENQYDDLVDQVLAEGVAEWRVGDKRLNLKRGMVEDVREADLDNTIGDLGLPLLVMHSPTDTVVGIENASQIFAAARHPRSFVSLEGSDHLLTAPGQARRAARIVSAWADPYLGAG
ncbi:alpha/beta hydrolase family protein [Isoptericola cucumis]|uniref:Osmotically inducible protein OsmC n=1 Tax=Isoptericola cucumis TaxID=1776856 RepID=A0ABQ2B2D4_9MICO|nr:alpha/beta fold hydrolase [Isoptericola cucumis]GGI04614.1 osmotically inducible protein OsmC [Isoptericola cucumis]